MPRPRRLTRARSTHALPPVCWRHLCDLPEPDDEETRDWQLFVLLNQPMMPREAWAQWREQAVAEHVAHHPGCRPALWWRHEAPELRRQVGGRPNRPGVLRLPYGLLAPYPPDPSDPPRFESQAAYLRRIGLLLPGEARRLKPADYEPETIMLEDADG